VFDQSGQERQREKGKHPPLHSQDWLHELVMVREVWDERARERRWQSFMRKSVYPAIMRCRV
jgi:hypothetical protein